LQWMTYAKRKAARPATAATATEPWTLDAAPVNWDGAAGVVGEVAFFGGAIDPVVTGAAFVGVMVTVE